MIDRLTMPSRSADSMETMIVVVDDEATVLKFLMRTLLRGGFSAEGFASAHGALKALGQLDAELIVSDVSMPEIDGFELRARYVAQFPGRDTPFIFLSALTEEDYIIRGLEEGASDYLTKPVNPRIFLAKVRALIRQSTQAPRSSHVATEPSDPVAPGTGRFSSVRVDGQFFEIHTRYDTGPDGELITSILVDGLLVSQKTSRLKGAVSNEVIDACMEEQHKAAERMLIDQQSAAIDNVLARRPTEAETKEHFIRQGLEQYRRGDVEGARSTLCKGVTLFPDDRLIRANLALVQKKMPEEGGSQK